MNILVLEFDITGKDPRLCAIVGYGYTLLDNTLRPLEKGGELVRPQDSLYVGKEDIAQTARKFGKPEEDLIDEIRSLCFTDTIIASRDPYITRLAIDCMCERHLRIDPPNISSALFDIKTLSAPLLFDGDLDKCQVDSYGEIYKIGEDLKRFYHPSFVRAMISTEILIKSMTKQLVIDVTE